jgi:hypothetical protein
MNYREFAKKKYAKEMHDEISKMEFGQDFLARCFCEMSSQKYSAVIENKIREECGLKKIPNYEDKGDFISTREYQNRNYYPFLEFLTTGVTVELKVSFKSKGNDGKPYWNLVQLRPYENFDYYLFLFIDPENGCDWEWFLLKKDDVSNQNFTISGAHGTKQSNANNLNVEYRMSVSNQCGVRKEETQTKLNYLKLKELNILKDVQLKIF